MGSQIAGQDWVTKTFQGLSWSVRWRSSLLALDCLLSLQTGGHLASLSLCTRTQAYPWGPNRVLSFSTRLMLFRLPHPVLLSSPVGLVTLAHSRISCQELFKKVLKPRPHPWGIWLSWCGDRCLDIGIFKQLTNFVLLELCCVHPPLGIFLKCKFWLIRSHGTCQMLGGCSFTDCTWNSQGLARMVLKCLEAGHSSSIGHFQASWSSLFLSCFIFLCPAFWFFDISYHNKIFSDFLCNLQWLKTTIKNKFRWEGGWRGRGHMHTYGWFMLMYGRSQHKFVKQLSFN